MPYDVYIFDLDGTLLNTLDDLTDAVNAALSAYGCPIRTKEEVRSFVGNGIRLLMERATKGGAKNPRFAEIFREFVRYYGEHCFDKTAPYPGVTEMLKKLKANGAKAAIVSNKADFAVKALKERYFAELIAFAVGENESAGIRRKPAPDSVFSALKFFGNEGSRAVYVGDSEVDIETAKNAKLPCISVTWGFKDREFLEKNGASMFADAPEEILFL